MTKFDAFMDHHVGLYTDDLEQYLSAFDADAVPYYLMSFTAGGDTWHAANVRVPGSQLLIELLATNYTGAHRMAAAPAPAPRLGDARARELKAMTTDRAYVYAVRVARACTDLDAVAAFYTGALGATQVSETATRKCWKLATTSSFTDTTEVCYTEHADDANDAMTVKEYEDALNGAHASLLKGQPKCGMDKWLDNHLAVDPTDHGSNEYGDALVAYVDATADLYYYCEPAMGPGASGYTLHYVIDPAGWGVQVDASFTSPPQACASSSLAIVEGGFNPACDLGTCSSL
jgi:catechol 2,3-dioxygenase-like lactoylglutathione lyase family enzyme